MKAYAVSRTIKPLRMALESNDEVRNAVLSPWAVYLGLLLRRKPARLYKVGNGEQLALPVSEPLTALAYRPCIQEGSIELAVATGVESTSVLRIDPQRAVSWPLVLAGAHSVAYSHDGSFLAAGSAHGRVRVWTRLDAGHPKLVADAAVGTACVIRLALDAGNTRLFLLTAKGRPLRMELGEPEVRPSPCLRGSKDRPFEWDCYCVATHPFVPVVAFGGYGRYVYIDHGRNLITVLETGVGAYVRDLCFLPSGRELLVVGQLGVKVFDLSTRQCTGGIRTTAFTGCECSETVYVVTI